MRDPGPLATQPRIQNSGFGWEEGGKRSDDGNVQRHMDNVRERQAYNMKTIGGTRNHGFGNEESAPPEVYVDEKGQYGVAPQYVDEVAVVDSHRAGGSQSVGLLGKGRAQQVKSAEEMARASAARRAAIAAASSIQTAPAEKRAPLSRTHSLSKDSRQSARPPTTGPSTTHQVPSLPNNATDNLPPPIGTSRSFSRSVSMDSRIYAKPSAISRPPQGLAPIPSQSSQNGLSSSQGSGPAPSQGAIARHNALELEAERRKREGVEQENKALREQMEAMKHLDLKEKSKRQDPSKQGESTHDLRQQMEEFKQKYFTAIGEANSIRRRLDAVSFTMRSMLAVVDPRTGQSHRARTDRQAAGRVAKSTSGERSCTQRQGARIPHPQSSGGTISPSISIQCDCR
jgi:hypothetical protein